MQPLSPLPGTPLAAYAATVRGRSVTIVQSPRTGWVATFRRHGSTRQACGSTPRAALRAVTAIITGEAV